MRRHGPVTAHCTDSEDFPKCICADADVDLLTCGKILWRLYANVMGRVRVRVRFEV